MQTRSSQNRFLELCFMCRRSDPVIRFTSCEAGSRKSAIFSSSRSRCFTSDWLFGNNPAGTSFLDGWFSGSRPGPESAQNSGQTIPYKTLIVSYFLCTALAHPAGRDVSLRFTFRNTKKGVVVQRWSSGSPLKMEGNPFHVT